MNDLASQWPIKHPNLTSAIEKRQCHSALITSEQNSVIRRGMLPLHWRVRSINYFARKRILKRKSVSHCFYTSLQNSDTEAPLPFHSLPTHLTSLLEILYQKSSTFYWNRMEWASLQRIWNTTCKVDLKSTGLQNHTNKSTANTHTDTLVDPRHNLFFTLTTRSHMEHCSLCTNWYTLILYKHSHSCFAHCQKYFYLFL